MFKTKRKRAVVLALIAFFCTAATTYVAVDWKRLGGGFLAYFKGRSGQTVASGGGGSSSGRHVDSVPTSTDSHPAPTVLQHVAAADTSRHGGTGGGAGHKGDDDLFKYGDPAAGGIPPGSFIVAQNETPASNTNNGGAPAPAPAGAPAAPEGAAPATTSGGVGSPAPGPTGSNSGLGDSGIVVKSPTPSPPTPTPPAPTPATPTPPAPTPAPPVTAPPAGTPSTTTPTPPAPAPITDSPAPAPTPTQSSSTDGSGTDTGGDTGTDPSGGNTTPTSSPGNVSSVPEASNLAMMSLGALFLAVAAARRRKND